MPEMYLKQLLVDHLSKNKEWLWKFKETVDCKCIY